MNDFIWEQFLQHLPGLSASTILTIFLIFAPTIFIIKWLDRVFINECTRKQIVTALAIGALCVIPVAGLVTNMVTYESISQNALLKSFYRAFITAAAVEELIKFAGILLVLFLTKLHKSPKAIVMIATIVGLGFATIENIMYVSDEGMSTAIIRAFTAVPCHACLGAITGYYLGRYFSEVKTIDLIKTIVLPILLHGMYDLPLMAGILGAAQSNTRSTLLLAIFTLSLLIFWTRYVVIIMSRQTIILK